MSAVLVQFLRPGFEVTMVFKGFVIRRFENGASRCWRGEGGAAWIVSRGRKILCEGSNAEIGPIV